MLNHCRVALAIACNKQGNPRKPRFCLSGALVAGAFGYACLTRLEGLG